MDRAERVGVWIRQRSERTKRFLLTALIGAPWALFRLLPPLGIPQAFAVILATAIAAGASVVAVTWTSSLDLVRWKRAALAYLASVNIGLITFSYAYWSLSKATATAFSVPLSKIDATYFTFTVFTTTGFGDITAQGGEARLVVVLQMALGFAAVAIGLAVLLTSRPAPA